MIHRRPPAGFTLIEVLLAMAILGMITMLVYMSFVPALGAVEEVNAQRRVYRRTRILFGRMENEIRGAYLDYVNEASTRRGCELDERDCPYIFVGKDGGDEDELTFTTLAGRPGSRVLQADQIWVRYFVERDPDTKEYGLYREQRFIHTGESRKLSSKSTPKLLFPGVTRFNLHYINRGTTDEHLNEWDSTTGMDEVQKGQLPRAVEVMIEFPAGEDRPPISLATTIEIPMSRPLKPNSGGPTP